METAAGSMQAQDRYTLEPRRARLYRVEDAPPPEAKTVEQMERLDVIYRTLCSILYNFVPTSGHPGGSISSGRIVAGLMYDGMDYDFSNPDREESDLLVYAAGHKALGLYASWALRDEVVRAGRPAILPAPSKRLRFEDLLGFRRNPTQDTPLFKEFESKPLDGHPTPATPHVKVATGASGVGVPAGFGVALALADLYGIEKAPKVHLLEGEGGMTPGRVHEAIALAATAGLSNIIMHVDWNQASIDSNRVCAEGGEPGDYVQWNPIELLLVHDWNVVVVSKGMDLAQVLAAQRFAKTIKTGQPTAIVYRTVKGWKYGMEGRISHGAGHKFYSDGYLETLKPAQEAFGVTFPKFEGEKTGERIERTYWETLLVLRGILEREKEIAPPLGGRVEDAKKRLDAMKRTRRSEAPAIARLYAPDPELDPAKPPAELNLAPGTAITLRESLGNALGFLNKKSGGGFLVAAADLLGSTSVANIAKPFPAGYYHAVKNPGSRTISAGGICEDAMGALMAGVAATGGHIGVTSSYGAFIAALEHVAARLHGIGQQAARPKGPWNPFIMVNAHAGLKTGEDGPTHADPQNLQLLQENFPPGVCITLTPWEPGEVWALLLTALAKRPAVICPFVTRPTEKVVDRAKLGLPPAHAAVTGVYALRKAKRDAKKYHGSLVLQESGTTITFVEGVLPKLDADGINMNIYCVSSAELFAMLPEKEREAIFPQAHAQEAMGITGFTMPTLYRWVLSREGRAHSLHPFRIGHYPGSGMAEKVLEEAKLDPKSQYEAVLAYAKAMERPM